MTENVTKWLSFSNFCHLTELVKPGLLIRLDKLEKLNKISYISKIREIIKINEI